MSGEAKSAKFLYGANEFDRVWLCSVYNLLNPEYHHADSRFAVSLTSTANLTEILLETVSRTYLCLLKNIRAQK